MKTVMRNGLPGLILLFLSFAATAQDGLEIKLKALLETGQYDTIVAKYLPPRPDYSAMTLYYTGFACFMKEDNDNCIRLMTLAIKKDPQYSRSYFIRGSTYNYLGKYQEAIRDFKSAIALNSQNGEYYSGLGDAWYNLHNDSFALKTYIKSATRPDAPERAFLMIAQIYAEQREDDKALEAYYTAQTKVAHGSDAYTNVLYNIALFETLKGNYDKAEATLNELLQLVPNDFQAYAKMVQVYYGRKQYEKAKPWKDKLYEAHKKGILPENLQDKFCFDQFKWKDKLIQVYERYEEGPKKEIYNKHLFYVVNPDGKVAFRLQTEYSPLSTETNGPNYLLCLTAEDIHSTFNIGFNNNLKYDDLKAAVISVLEGKVRPAATSRVSSK